MNVIEWFDYWMNFNAVIQFHEHNIYISNTVYNIQLH